MVKPYGRIQKAQGMFLSTNNAKYLLRRNAGQKELFRKKSYLLEKAKSKEERSLNREREYLKRRHTRTQDLGHTLPFLQHNSPEKTSQNIAEDKCGNNNEPRSTVQQRNEAVGMKRRHGVSSASLHPGRFSVGTFTPTQKLSTLQQTLLHQETTISDKSLGRLLPPVRFPSLPSRKIAKQEKKSNMELKDI